MSETSNRKKKGKLKVGVNEFVGPILKRLTEVAKNHADSSTTRSDIEKTCILVEKMKDVFERRENWDSELMDHFGRIERQIDSWNENKGEQKINWVLINNKLYKLLEKESVNLSMVNTTSDKDSSTLPQKSSTYEVSEPSNNNNSDGLQIDEYINQLNPQQQDCLYSLGIFPENAKLKKRLLFYWWIGLGLVPLEENKNTTTELLVETFFSNLMKNGILQPIHVRRHNEVVNWCIINPTIHRKLVFTCESKRLLSYLKSKEGTLHFYCDDRSNVRALLNLNHQYLNSEELTKKVLSNHLTMQAVQFGNWHCNELRAHNVVEETGSEETKYMDHIEVDKTDFLNKLGKKVAFLSLRGISEIECLPDLIGKLEDLRILDLRDCHSLEYLPKKQRSKLHKIIKLEFQQKKWFKNLIYLDISGCFLLHHMPQWVCELSNLEVLKGFVASNASKEEHICRLCDLSKLMKLRKLSIKIAMHLNLEYLSALEPLENLFVLIITWSINEKSEGNQITLAKTKNQSKHKFRASGGEDINGQNNEGGKVPTISFPKNLEKLDIRCYPEAEAPELLNPAKLKKLKRLYIRGGKLTKIGNSYGWMVEILRLRYVKYVNFNWYYLSSIFNKLKYVEYEQCFNLKRFPKERSCWVTKTDGPLPSASDEPNNEVLINGRPEIIITRNKTTPLENHAQMMMLELTGWGSIKDRPGLDLVAVLDVSMGPDMIAELKTAMQFVINKLSPIDRLSIVVFSNKARMVYPLSHATKKFRKQAEEVVGLLFSDNLSTSSMFDGLRMGLKIIDDRNNSSERVSGIMLLSGSMKYFYSHEHYDQLALESVAVHTFGFGPNHHPVQVLRDIARNSMGGTYSNVRFGKNLTKAFSVCLAGLLTVAVQDLTLTISPIKGESTLERVSPGGYRQHKDDADGSVTVRFGDLYNCEVRKILVDLQLPAIDKERDSEVLKISCSYKVKKESFKAAPVVVTVSRRAEVSVDQLQPRPEVIAEKTRLEIIDQALNALLIFINREGSKRAKRDIIDAQNKMEALVENEPKFNALFENIRAELRWILTEMQYPIGVKESKLECFRYSLLLSNYRQRTAVRGDDPEKFLQFSTPTMREFLKQADKFN